VIALRRRGHQAAAFLVAFVPCAFAVTGNLVFPIGTIFAERLAYLPLIGFCGLAGVVLASVPGRALPAVLVAVALVAGAWRTAERCGDFKNEATIAEATAAASPGSVKALYNAARTLIGQGRTADAKPVIERMEAIRRRAVSERARADDERR
jgi:protein O-mannosyl-transferase